MPKTCVLILLDGLGDRAHEQLDHRTPLQAAETPTLDRLASLGSTGLYHAGKLGQPMPSENAHFAMFGSPMKEFPGRGPLEALGAGVPLGENDVAMLAHFTNVVTTIEDQIILKYDRICGTPEEVGSLYAATSNFEQDGVTIDLHQTGGMFSVLVMRGDVSPYITDSNPMVDGRYLSAVVPMNSHKDDPATIRTANVLSDYIRWSIKKLENVTQNKKRVQETLPPINGIVTQRAGQLRPRTPMLKRYGLRAISTASGYMYKGLASYLGMDFHPVLDSRNPGKDIANRLRFADQVAEEYDFIHVHSKAPDHAALTRSPNAKVKAIESIDQGLAEVIDPLLDNDDILLVVTSDHSTPSCGTLLHSGEPVPTMFVGQGVRRDNVTKFDEINTAGGCLGMMRGDEMMHMILNYMDRARLAGVHDTPEVRQYWPGDYLPFSMVPEDK